MQTKKSNNFHKNAIRFKAQLQIPVLLPDNFLHLLLTFYMAMFTDAFN